MKFDEAALRPGQREALHTIETRLALGEKTTAVILPCRYGKSDVIRVAALKMRSEGRSAVTLAVSPNVILRRQLADVGKWETAIARYKISGAENISIVQLDGMKVPFTPNRELFVSATTQLAAGSGNSDVFASWIESEVNRTGLPVSVFIDECHMSSDGNQWGDLVPKFIDSGAHVVLLTATADRADGKRIPGFRFESDVVEEDTKVYRCTDGASPELVKVDVYEGSRTRLRLIADVEVSFRDAWNIGVLCKVSRTPFDVNLRDVGVVGEREKLLSELSATQTRKVLGRLVRHPLLIEEGCRRMVDRLSLRRVSRPDAAAIVFCGNDREDDGSGNGHPLDIERQINRFDSGLIVVVATSADGEGTQALQRFIDGYGDVLVVKQMAGIGLDIGRLKIGLDLSPTRTYSAFVQRMMRCATPHEGVMSMEWIAPDDVISAALFEKLVKSQGGEAVVSDLTHTDSYEKRREEDSGEAGQVLFPEGVIPGDFDDSGSVRADRSLWETASRLMAAFPQLADTSTHAEIASRCKAEGVSFEDAADSSSPTQVVDTGAEADSLRRIVVSLAKDITKHNTKDNYSPELWRSESKLVYRAAKKKADFPIGLELEKCNDLVLLRRLRQVFETWTARIESVRLF